MGQLETIMVYFRGCIPAAPGTAGMWKDRHHGAGALLLDIPAPASGDRWTEACISGKQQPSREASSDDFIIKCELARGN